MTAVGAILSGEQEGATMRFGEAADRIVSDLSEIGGDDGLWREELEGLRQRTIVAPAPFRPSVKWALAASFVRRNLGAEMAWLPLRADKALQRTGRRMPRR